MLPDFVRWVAGGRREQWTVAEGAVDARTAIPNEGQQCEEWVTKIELDSLTDNPIVITMAESRIVGARFAPIVRTRALSISGSGTGTVKPTPAGVSLENALVFRYTDGEVVALNVEVDAGSVFSGWAGNVPAGLENDNPLELLMDRDRTITARFEPIVTLSVQVTGDGEVIVDPDLDAYPAGSEVTLTAEAADAFEFARWDGDASGVSAVLTVTLNTSKTIEAIFVPEGTGTNVEEFVLFVDVAGDGVVSPGGGRFEAGTLVTLVATPGFGPACLGRAGAARGAGRVTRFLVVLVGRVREGQRGRRRGGVGGGGGGPLPCRITRKSAVALGIEPGKSVFAQVKSVALLGSFGGSGTGSVGDSVGDSRSVV